MVLFTRVSGLPCLMERVKKMDVAFRYGLMALDTMVSGVMVWQMDLVD